MRVVVSRDGAFACAIESKLVAVLGLPSLERLAEIAIEEDSDIALVGDRVLVLTADGTMYVVDPLAREGPEATGELQLEPGSKILATSGDHALVALAAGTGIVSLAGLPSLSRLPSRLAIGAAGAAATADHFILVVGGALEEWSAVTRAPLRRFRLEKPVAARAAGGGARQVWFAPESELDEIVTIPLVGAARPAKLQLPEPAARVVADPGGGWIATLGAKTGMISVAALGERTASPLGAGKFDDLAWRGASALVCARGKAIEIVDVARASQRSALTGSTLVDTPSSSAGDEAHPSEKAPEKRVSTMERLAAWKERVARRDFTARDDLEVVTASQPKTEASQELSTHDWRDAVAGWARRHLGGVQRDPPLLAACKLNDLTPRLGISPDDAPFLWLVYGARLCGFDGVAPYDLAPLTMRRWDEALGRGELAASGAFAWRGARVGLLREIVAMLDEMPPMCGTYAASPINVEHSVAVVAPSDVELAELAALAAPQIGAMLVPNKRGLGQPERLLLEARARALVPLVPRRLLAGVPAQTVVLVVEDEREAAELHLSVELEWPTSS